MMKLLGLILGFALAAFLGWQVVYAQTPSPTPSPSPTVSPSIIIDEDDDLDDDEIIPEAAPQTGFGGLSK